MTLSLLRTTEYLWQGVSSREEHAKQELLYCSCFLCIIYTTKRKFGVAYKWKTNAENSISTWQHEHCVFHAWFHLASAYYQSALPDSSTDYRREKSVETELEKSRVYFLRAFATENLGNYKLLAMLCLWWQVFFAGSVENYKEKALLHHLTGSTEWNIDVSNFINLLPCTAARYRVMLLTCAEELDQTTSAIKELAVRCISQTLVAIDAACGKGKYNNHCIFTLSKDKIFTIKSSITIHHLV